MSTPGNFREALIRVYRENPCAVLPNALWKSLPWADQFETEFKIEDGLIVQLIAWNPSQLMLFWNRDRYLPQTMPGVVGASLEFALLHQHFMGAIRLEDFSQHQSYFRLVHTMQAIPERVLPGGYSFSVADPLSEAIEISALISACYADMYLSPETVLGWCQHPVFDADLWVWVIDNISEKPVGLGIAEFDPTIAEGSLEWIQVLPDYRGRGLGKLIVYELLRRLEEQAEFTTVAGQVDNQTHPEMLYRSCGFVGEDIWWVLRK